MAMQTDVKATAPLTSTGPFKDQATNSITYRTRVKGVYIVNGASAGSVAITSGSATLVTINTPTAANSGNTYMLLPDQGILAETGLNATITNAASVVVYYG